MGSMNKKEAEEEWNRACNSRMGKTREFMVWVLVIVKHVFQSMAV